MQVSGGGTDVDPNKPDAEDIVGGGGQGTDVTSRSRVM
jgi:hypothetical protein